MANWTKIVKFYYAEAIIAYNNCLKHKKELKIIIIFFKVLTVD